MAKSLIRKNQLHPDVAELISGYGNDFFITDEELGFALNELVLSLGSGTINIGSVVFVTGNQTINGVKTFNSRPIFNGSGLATTGELGGSTIFNGNRRITANVPGFQNLTPGGNDVVTFLNNVFYPFNQATINLNTFTVQELGTTAGTPTIPLLFQGTISTGSMPLSNLSQLRPFIGTTPNLPVVSPTLNFTLSSTNLNLTNNTNNLSVKMTGIDQNSNLIQISSDVQTLFFEAPTYAGSGVSTLFNNPSNLITVLSAQSNGNNGKSIILKPSNSFRQVNVTTNGFYYFVYPDSWGSVSQIQDANFGFNFNISNDFITGAITLQLANGTNHNYRYYRNTNQITLNNYGVKYYFN